MSLALWGGPPPKGDAAWGGVSGCDGDRDSSAGIWLQACNAPLVSLLQAAAFGASGAMQYKAIQVLYWAGYVCAPDSGGMSCRVDWVCVYVYVHATLRLMLMLIRSDSGTS